MSLKRIFLVLPLVLIFAALTLAACSTEEEPSEPAPAQPAQTAPTAAPAAQTQPAPAATTAPAAPDTARSGGHSGSGSVRAGH